MRKFTHPSVSAAWITAISTLGGICLAFVLPHLFGSGAQPTPESSVSSKLAFGHLPKAENITFVIDETARAHLRQLMAAAKTDFLRYTPNGLTPGKALFDGDCIYDASGLPIVLNQEHPRPTKDGHFLKEIHNVSVSLVLNELSSNPELSYRNWVIVAPVPGIHMK